jgi:uncharacterized protein (TIGR02391 family)
MARSERSRIGAVLDVARRIALDVEARTSIIPLPPEQPPDLMQLYDTLISDPALKLATRKLFNDGSYPEAVGKAYTVVNNAVKKRTKTAHDGVDLMNHAFSEKAPILAITARKTDSQRNEHNGYRSIFTGVMQGIRNPHHHEHDLRDEADAALEMLVLANHLLRVANRAKKTRVKKATTP